MGKLVEEADFRLRFNEQESITMTVIEEIDAIVKVLADDEESTEQTQSQSSDESDLITEVNTKINQIIVE